MNAVRLLTTCSFLLCCCIISVPALAAPATAPSPRRVVEDRPFDPPRKQGIVFILDTVRAGDNAGQHYAFPQTLKAVSMLREPQTFALVVSSGNAPAVFGGTGLLPATKENKQNAGKFIDSLRPPAKPVSPLPAIRSGLNRPEVDLVYILADHEWADRDAVIKAITEMTKKQPKLKINTIYFQQKGQAEPSEAMLKTLNKISDMTDGTMIRVSDKDLDEDNAPPAKPAPKPSK